MKRLGASIRKETKMELRKVEARWLIRHYHEVIRTIKENSRMPDNAKQKFITAHKNRIKELRKYA